MNGFYFDLFRKQYAFQFKPEIIGIKEVIKERKGKIKEMLTRNTFYGNNINNVNRVCTSRNSKENLFKQFHSGSKTLLNYVDDNNKCKSPNKQRKKKSMMLMLSPKAKTHRRVESAFVSTKHTLFSHKNNNNSSSNSHSNIRITKSMNTLNNFGSLIRIYKPHKHNRNITLTSPCVSKTQTMFKTITTQCKRQYKRSLCITTSITNKFKHNSTLSRSKHIYKGNQQDIQALTEHINNNNIDFDMNLNTKQILTLDIKHVDKLSTESVYKNRNLYVTSFSKDNNNEDKGTSIYNITTQNNYPQTKALFIKQFRQHNSQKSFQTVERLLRLSNKCKEKLLRLNKHLKQKQQQYKQRLQSS